MWPVDEFARAGEAYYRSCKTEVGDDGLEPPTSGEFEVVFVLFAQPVDGGKPFVLDYKAARFVVGDDAGDDHN